MFNKNKIYMFTTINLLLLVYRSKELECSADRTQLN